MRSYLNTLLVAVKSDLNILPIIIIIIIIIVKRAFAELVIRLNAIAIS